MPAPRATAEPKTSIIAALVIFIVLFLAATVLAIVFYTKNEQYVTKADKAVSDLEEIANQSQIAAIKPLVDKSGGRIKKTAVARITDDMREMAVLVGGKDIEGFNLVGALGLVNNKADPLWAKVKGVMLDPALAERDQGLVRIIEALVAQNEDLLSKNDQANLDELSMEEQYATALQTKDDRIAKLSRELAVATQAAKANEEGYTGLEDELTSRYQEILDQRKDDIARLQDEKKLLQEDNGKLVNEMAKSRVEIKQLNDRLQQFQPKPETELAALEIDGEVISVVAREKQAYINLNRSDHIYRGLTFAVYDRFQPVPKTGQGKGSLEVIEIRENISKCRITDFDPTNPIMENDIISNLVWSRDKKYRFCVVGDFDFDGDGQADTDGEQRVRKLIEHWGAEVTKTFSVDTDFLVVGNEPILPPRPSDEYLDTDAAVAHEYRQAQQRVKDYRATRMEGAALGVPTFNLNRFLYFIGFYQQAKNQ